LLAIVTPSLGAPLAEDRAAITRQVKESSDIVAVIGTYLSLSPSAANYKALCPFHDDSRPSMQIDPKWQNYRCWSCGARGDVFSFVMHMEKVDFMQAREILARRAGIRLDVSEQYDNRLVLLDVMKWASERYQETLFEGQIAEEARLYLAKRRLNGPIVRQFGLGFAPPVGDWMVDQIHRTGRSYEHFEEVGLIARRQERGGYYDRFRDRIMFPIHDVQSRTVGFGGRILPNSPLSDRAPKYYNSSDTPLFNKSELLFGLDFARSAAMKEQALVVVEGYTDVMMAHQCGIEHVVATMGTALNQKHVLQLRRMVPKVILIFDADEGGNKGVDRALELFVSSDVDLLIASLPDGMDPCDWLIESGAEPFRKAISVARDALDFKLDLLLHRAGDSGVESTRRVVDGILTVLAMAPDVPGQAAQVKRELLLTRIAHRLSLRQETVWARFGELREKRKREETRERRESTPSASERSDFDGQSNPRRAPAPPLEKQLLQLLLADHRLVSEAAQIVNPEQITHPGLRKLLCGLYDLNEEGEIPDLDGLRMRLDHPALLEKALELQEIGRAIADRESYFRLVLEQFQTLKDEQKKKLLVNQLNSNVDHDAARQLFLKMLGRSNDTDLPSTEPT
jgi:DNA primase